MGSDEMGSVMKSCMIGSRGQEFENLGPAADSAERGPRGQAGLRDTC